MHNDSFIYVFLVFISFMCFSSLTTLFRDLSTMLNTSEDSSDSSFILDLEGVDIK